jgi:hypothetical protein
MTTPDLSEYSNAYVDGTVRGTTDYAPDGDEYGEGWRWRHSKGHRCRVCGDLVQNGSRYCYTHAGIGRKVYGQIRRLLARKAMWEEAGNEARRPNV